MSNYAVITGSAFEVDAPVDGNVRNYSTRSGARHFLGHETHDVIYACSGRCLDVVLLDCGLPAALLADCGSWVASTPSDLVGGTHLTIDWGVHYGEDWPDYTVNCGACEDVIHEGTE